MLDPLIKICGITRQQDADDAAEAGAGAIGFNFHPPSPRSTTSSTAARIATPPGLLRVGVFVAQTAVDVAAIAAEAHLDVIQWHGEMPASLPDLPLWVARTVNDQWHSPTRAGAIVLDTPAGPSAGGTGRSFDWSQVPQWRNRYQPPPIVLAGGLDPSNVADAIRTAAPWGVDAASRLESQPGLKDRTKVFAFVAAAKQEFLCLSKS